MRSLTLKSLVLLPLMGISLSFSDSSCSPGHYQKQPPQPKPSDKVIEVSVTNPRYFNKPRMVSGTGLFEASDRLIVKSQIRGVIEKTFFNEGDQIQAEATLATFRGEESQNKITAKQNEIQIVQNDLNSYKGMLEIFPTNQNNPQAPSPSEDAAYFLDEESKTNVVPPKPMGALNPEPVQNREELVEKIQLAETKLNTLNAELLALEESLKSLQIKSSIQGIITKRHVTDGSVVELGDSLFEVININPITLTFYVPQEVASYVDKDIKVTVNPLSAPDLKSEGLVYYVNPSIDPTKKALELKAHVSNDKNLIREGQEGYASVTTKRVDQVWVIPKKSIVTSEGKNYIYVQTGNKVRQTEVTLGESIDGSEIIVDANLRVDDLIVISNTDQISDGTFIKVAQSTELK